MTTNMQDMLDQAFEAGRSAERKMAEIAALGVSLVQNVKFQNVSLTVDNDGAPVNGSRKRPGRKAKAGPMSAINKKAAGAIKELTVARGVKAAPAPRTKGVKDAIVSLIGSSPNGLTTAQIIAATGFKPASVNGTLMGLKKDGKAIQENKFWGLLPPQSHDAGNSGVEAQEAV